MSLNLLPERSKERGFVAVWMGLTMVLLVAFAGMAVDVGNWRLNESRQQNAADAAALGGVVLLNSSTQDANSVALQIADEHGYAPSEVSVQVVSAGRLRITIDRELDNYFLSVIGRNTQDISATAVAEYSQAVELAGGGNSLGNVPPDIRVDDDGGDDGEYLGYWLLAAGPDAGKANGSRYATLTCEGPGRETSFRCDGNPVPNEEYDNVQYYAVTNSSAGQALEFQVYDGIFANTGYDCKDITALSRKERRDLNINDDQYDDSDNQWCAGDQSLGKNVTTNVVTTFQFLGPDNTPTTNGDNPEVCPEVEFGSYEDVAVFDYLNPDGGGSEWQVEDDGRVTFAESFHRWFTACEVDSPVAGTYLMAVRTSGASGHNRYSVRAGSGDPFVGPGVQVSAIGKTPMSIEASTFSFDIAKIVAPRDGQELQIDLFNLGVSKGGTSLEFERTDGARIRNCVFEGEQIWKGPKLKKNECEYSNVKKTNGKDGYPITVSIPLNEGSCKNSSGCWIQVEVKYPRGRLNGMNDVTISANLNGDFVRLVE